MKTLVMIWFALCPALVLGFLTTLACGAGFGAIIGACVFGFGMSIMGGDDE